MEKISTYLSLFLCCSPFFCEDPHFSLVSFSVALRSFFKIFCKIRLMIMNFLSFSLKNLYFILIFESHFSFICNYILVLFSLNVFKGVFQLSSGVQNFFFFFFSLYGLYFSFQYFCDFPFIMMIIIYFIIVCLSVIFFMYVH